AKDPRVKTYRFVSRAEALAISRKNPKTRAALKLLPYNPYPPSEVVTPTKGDFTPKIAADYGKPKPPGVADVTYGAETTKKILHYANVFNILFAIALVI